MKKISEVINEFKHGLATEGYAHVVENLNHPPKRRSLLQLILISDMMTQPHRPKAKFIIKEGKVIRTRD